MKQLIFFLAFIAISSLTEAQTVSASPENLQKLNWLTGTWQRLDMKPKRSATERWEKISAAEWQGWGVSMKGKDTSFVEKLHIIAKDNLIFYVADVKGNKNAVYFQFVSLSEDHFVCENPAHDFPQRIEYKLRGNQLQASISGGGRTIPFLFEKKIP